MQQRLGGRDRTAQHLGNFLVGKAFVTAEDHRGALGLGQFLDGLLDFLLQLALDHFQSVADCAKPRRTGFMWMYSMFASSVDGWSRFRS